MYSFYYIKKRIKTGARRYLRTFNFLGLSSNRWHRQIRHKKRHFRSSPRFAGILFLMALPIGIIDRFFKDRVKEEPLIIVLLFIWEILIVLLEFWHAGSEKYLESYQPHLE